MFSCGNQGGSISARQAAYNSYDRPASLPANPANVRVKVSIDKGLTYVMEGDKALLVMPVGVGKAATPTPMGTFRIFNMEHYRRANTHGFAVKGDQITKLHATHDSIQMARGDVACRFFRSCLKQIQHS